MRAFLAQPMGITRDYRQQIEWVVRGQYPIAVGALDFILAEFEKEGLGRNVKPLAIDTPMGGNLSHAKVIALINRAPHPNAAKVFLNWALSRDGQVLHTRHVTDNSRRLDTQDEPSLRRPPDPNAKFPPVLDREELQTYLRRAGEIAREVIK